MAASSAPDNPEPFPPFDVARSDRIYDSPWCGLRRDELILHDGSLQEHHVFEISDAVVVVPVLKGGSIVMIGQYRYPHGKTHWELPAGRIAPEEPPEKAVERELLEETGFRPGRLVPLPGFYPTNGISAHFAHAFVALDCEKIAEATPEPSEQIIVRVFGQDEVEALVDAGRLEDGFSALPLLYYLRWRERGRFE
jgi:8-oxo-dGTP pyrophosphatase MutT (NUDIX family)